MPAQSSDSESTSAKENFAEQVRAARRNRDLITALARWRDEHGPNQREIAKKMHTSQPAVTRLESHQHDPQLSTLARYVAALGLTVDFVLSDSKTGSPVWTSIEEPSTLGGLTGITRTVEDIAPGSAHPGERSDAPELVVIGGAWSKLSHHLLKPDVCVIAASNEPGWDVLYEISQNKPVSADSVTPQGGRLEEAEDPKVLGVFEPDGSDPVAIATVTESGTNELRQVHKLVGKIRYTRPEGPGLRTGTPRKVRVFDLPMPSSADPAARPASQFYNLIFGSPPANSFDVDLTLPIEDLNLSVRAYNGLKREGIHSVDELVAYSKKDLISIPNFGSKSVDEVERKLVDMGLSLKATLRFNPARRASSADVHDNK